MPRSAQSKAIREELRKAIDRDGVKAELDAVNECIDKISDVDKDSEVIG